MCLSVTVCVQDSDSETYNTLMEGTMKWMPKLYCSLLFDLDFWFLTDRQGCALNKKKTTLCTVSTQPKMYCIVSHLYQGNAKYTDLNKKLTMSHKIHFDNKHRYLL